MNLLVILKETRTQVVSSPPIERYKFAAEQDWGLLKNVPISIDLGSAGLARAVTDDDGEATFDLNPFLPCMSRDQMIEIVPLLGESRVRHEILLTLRASSLGVTWDEPRQRPGEVPKLVGKIACSGLAQGAPLPVGEVTKLELSIRNEGMVSAYDVRASLAMLRPVPGVKLKVLSPLQREKLYPEETWTVQAELATSLEVEGKEEIELVAEFREVTGLEHPSAHLLTSCRALPPPQLRIVEWSFSAGSDGVLEAGDQVVFRFWVQNLGLGKAREVTVDLSSNDPTLKLAAPFQTPFELAPAKIEEVVWNMSVPSKWRPPVPGNPRLPLNLEITELRPKYCIHDTDFVLALGDRSQQEQDHMTERRLAALEESAEKTLSSEAQANDVLAELAERRKKNEEIKKEALEIAEKVKLELQEEERNRAELERLRREREERARQAAAERQQLKARSYALIVGIDEYDDQEILPLKYAVRDAKALEAALTDTESGLFHEDNVVLLTSGAADPALRPTKTNIMRNLVMMTSKLKPDDRFLFFFAGHGSTDKEGDGNYLIAQNNSLQTIKYEGIQLREHLLDAMEDCRAGQQVLIVDACHSGLRKARAADPRAITVLSKGIDDALEDFRKGGSGRFVLSSCSQDEVSHEDDTLQHGVFTYYLVDGLRAIKKDARTEVDANLDGQIATGELFRHVRENVERWCRQNQRQLQTPRSRSDDSGASIPLTGLQERAAVVGE